MMDNEHLTALESFVIQMNDSSSDSRFKVIFPGQIADGLLAEKLRDLLGAQAVDHQAILKKEYDSTNIVDTLGRVLKDNLSYKLEETGMALALGCLAAAVNHLQLLSSGLKDFTLEKYTLSEYLRLDVAALAALNVFPQKNHELLSGSAGSLFGLLNQCKTSIGTRLLKKWLKQPTT